MLLIPSIELKGGEVVQTRAGDPPTVHRYTEDPVACARRWVDTGARRLQVVDLDGVDTGRPEQATVITDIMAACPEVEVQVGGGVRDEDAVQAYVEAGAQYIIIGTRAVNAPHFVRDVCLQHPGHIIVGLDVLDGRVATDGWSKLSNHDILDLARHFERDGISAIIYTDLRASTEQRAGDFGPTRRLAQELTIPVFAAGGIATLADVEQLCGGAEDGLAGAVLGIPIYEGTLDFKAALKLADRLDRDAE